MKKTIKSLLAIAIAAFALSACSDVPEPAGYSIQPKGGTPGGGDAIEVTCAEAVTATNNLADGATSTETYAVTGYITEVVGSVSRNQQTFWIADTKDGGKVFEAYFADLPDGVTEFKKGMKVKITGNLIKYVNSSTGAVTPEIKNAKVEILESGDEPGGGGDVISVTCAEAVTATNKLADGATSTETYAVTGYITEVVGSVSRNQQTFWMADTKDGGKVFEAYYADLPSGISAFAVGMKVKITGNLIKYVNSGTGAVTPEIKNATVEVLEGGGESGGGDQPGINKGTETNPLTVAEAFSLIDSQGSSTTNDCYVKGIISKVESYNSKYKSITYWISEDGNTTGNQLQVYSGKGLNGADFASQDDLTTGKTVVIKGNLKKYNTTYEFDKTSSIISIK